MAGLLCGCKMARLTKMRDAISGFINMQNISSVDSNNSFAKNTLIGFWTWSPKNEFPLLMNDF